MQCARCSRSRRAALLMLLGNRAASALSADQEECRSAHARRARSGCALCAQQQHTILLQLQQGRSAVSATLTSSCQRSSCQPHSCQPAPAPSPRARAAR
jgi:hypothetical protein